MHQDLNEMAIFASVAEQGSFTQAAVKLGMPKSSVSRHISQLEHRLGERLLNRTTRSMKLTEVGKLYFKYCRRIVEEATLAQSALSALQAQPSGLLKVSAPLAFGAPLLQGLFNEFLYNYPKINFELHLDNRNVDLVTEGIDVAVRVGPLAESSLVARKVGSTVQCLCATPEYIEKNGEPESIEDLKNFDIIKHPQIPLSLENEELVSVHSRFSANDMGVIKSMALQSFGIGIVPLPLAFEEISSGQLKPLLLAHPLESRDFFLVYPSRKQLATKTLAFVNYMTAQVQKMDHWNVSILEYLDIIEKKRKQGVI